MHEMYACILYIILLILCSHSSQGMSESVASALQYPANDRNIQTRVHIRMIDGFFDCLNVLKWKENVSPYAVLHALACMHLKNQCNPCAVAQCLIRRNGRMKAK